MKICTVEGCHRRASSKGLCQTHRKWQIKGKPLTDSIAWYRPDQGCKVEKCANPHSCKGYCKRHYDRVSKGRDPHAPFQVTGEWGPWTVTRKGYVVRWRKVDGKTQAQSEHKLAMENKLGRELLPHENVHHLNGQRADNRPENLELWSRSQPPGQRVADKLAWCREYLAQYEGKEID